MSDRRSDEQTADTPPGARVLIPRPLWSGPWTLTQVPISNGEARPGSDDGSPGRYRVTYVLLNPLSSGYSPSINLQDLLAKADSLIAFPPGVTSSRVVLTDEGRRRIDVEFLPNATGRIATASVELEVPNFRAAEHLAYSIIAPILSTLAFRGDVEVDLAGYRIAELATGAERHQFGLLARPAVIPEDVYLSRPEYRRILASYREALNARNPFFQFLAFYKVAEATRKLRAERQREAKRQGQAFARPVERIPADEAELVEVPDTYREHFRPYLGKKFNAVLDDAFRGLVRNALAHLDPGGDSLNADLARDVVTVEVAVPVIRYIARQMVLHEFDADAQYHATKEEGITAEERALPVREGRNRSLMVALGKLWSVLRLVFERVREGGARSKGQVRHR